MVSRLFIHSVRRKQGSKWLQIRNVFAIFLVSGFWHGANWTFIVWGAVHAFCFLPLLLIGNNRKYLDVPAQGKWVPDIKELSSILTTFFLASLAWVFFRADSITDSFHYLQGIFTWSLFTIPSFVQMSTLGFIVFMLLWEWWHRDKEYGLAYSPKVPKILRRGSYYLILIMIFFFGSPVKRDFIYFQF